MRARKELRFKNTQGYCDLYLRMRRQIGSLSVLNYLLHGETTVSPTPFDTLELALHIV